MGSQQFCLRWNNHQTNLLSVFDQLLQNEALVDVTLACDGNSLKAHKVVLSACSPFFQTLFVENPCQHPIVILKDVNFGELKALIDFMYKGEVHVTHEQLNILLKTAESLKVKGLAEVTGSMNNDSGVEIHPHVHVSTIPHPNISSAKEGKNGTGENIPGTPIHSLQMQVHQKISSPSSPPPKRRKAKPRKRVTESSIQSDQEDSDAIDMTTTSPEMLESTLDMKEQNSENEKDKDLEREREKKYEERMEYEREREMEYHREREKEYQRERLRENERERERERENEREREREREFERGRDYERDREREHRERDSDGMGMLSGDMLEDGAPMHDRVRGTFHSSGANQVSLGPSSSISHRFPLSLGKHPLQPLCPSSSQSPSTSATIASIQDIRRLCQFSRQSQQHKPTWTEEDMVQALEAVQSGRLTYALAARKFDIPKATLHYYVILMKAVEAVRSGRMTTEVAAIKYNVRTSILMACLFGNHGNPPGMPESGCPPPTGPGPGMGPLAQLGQLQLGVSAAASMAPLSLKTGPPSHDDGDTDQIKKEN